MATPNNFSTRAKRTSTVFTAGNCPTASTTSPTRPPQICTTNSVARSIASRCNIKSTPRSKRNDESEPKPYWRDLPAITSGTNQADSNTIFCVSSLTALAAPPIKPAMLNAPCSSAITKVLSAKVTVFSFKHANSSPFTARRTMMLPCNLSASKTCMGCPNSSIT